MVMAFLRRSLGEKRALELLITGKVIPAEEAERLGFVNRVCNDEDFGAEVEKFANEIASGQRVSRHADEIFALSNRRDELRPGDSRRRRHERHCTDDRRLSGRRQKILSKS